MSEQHLLFGVPVIKTVWLSALIWLEASFFVSTKFNVIIKTVNYLPCFVLKRYHISFDLIRSKPHPTYQIHYNLWYIIEKSGLKMSSTWATFRMLVMNSSLHYVCLLITIHLNVLGRLNNSIVGEGRLNNCYLMSFNSSKHIPSIFILAYLLVCTFWKRPLPNSNTSDVDRTVSLYDYDFHSSYCSQSVKPGTLHCIQIM